MTKRVFISYRSTERAAIQILVHEISNLRGYKVWYDQQLVGGQDWWTEIMEALENADIVVLALSPAYLKSDPCKREYDYALRLGKPLLPVQIDPNLKIDQLGATLQRLQIIPFSPQQPERSALDAALAVTKGRPPAADQSQPSAPISQLADIRDVLNSPGDLKMEAQEGVFDQLRRYWNKHPNEAAQVAECLKLLLSRPDTVHSVHEDTSRLLAEIKPPQPSGVEPDAKSSRAKSSPKRRMLLAAALVVVIVVVGAALLPRILPGNATPENSGGAFNVDIIYGERDSLTVMMNAESHVSGLALIGRTTVTLAESFPSLVAAGYVAGEGMCLRYVRQGAEPPLPRSCSANRTLDTELSDDAVFWYDRDEQRYIPVTLKQGSTAFEPCPVDRDGAGRCTYPANDE